MFATLRYVITLVIGVIVGVGFIAPVASNAASSWAQVKTQAYVSFAWFGTTTALKDEKGEALNRAAILEKLIDEYVAREQQKPE